MNYNIIALDEVTSTNDVAMGSDYGAGTIVTARRQTAGRGQLHLPQLWHLLTIERGDRIKSGYVCLSMDIR